VFEKAVGGILLFDELVGVEAVAALLQDDEFTRTDIPDEFTV